MKAVIRSCTIFLDHLDFILFMFGSQSWNQDEFTVSLLRDGSSSPYFLRKLFKFWNYANYLDHLDCNHGVLAVFYKKINSTGSKFLSHQRRQLLELVLVLSVWTIWISVCLCLAHIVEIRMNLLSVSFWDGSSSFFFCGSCSSFKVMRILLII